MRKSVVIISFLILAFVLFQVYRFDISTKLIKAIYVGNDVQIEKIINNPLLCVDKKGIAHYEFALITPMEAACAVSDYNTINLLTQKGASINGNLLYNVVYTFEKDDKKIIEYLLASGVECDGIKNTDDLFWAVASYDAAIEAKKNGMTIYKVEQQILDENKLLYDNVYVTKKEQSSMANKIICDMKTYNVNNDLLIEYLNVLNQSY